MDCFNATPSLTASNFLMGVELRFEVTHIGPIVAPRCGYLKSLPLPGRITNGLMLNYYGFQAQRILPVNAPVSSWPRFALGIRVGFVETINILNQSATAGSQSVGQEQCGEIRSAAA